ncbi:MAG: hypothetical protein F6K11_37955 [Leptolyngbya sp. SIO3F4]|nr:hypothetical protein [Leptolyngbya sp. SIO3F4]
MWDAKTKEIRFIYWNTSNIDSVSFSSDGWRTAITSSHVVRFWNDAQNASLATFYINSPPSSSTFIDSGKQIITSDAKTLWIFDTKTQELSSIFNSDLVFVDSKSDEKYVATVNSSNNLVQILTPVENEVVSTLQHTEEINDVIFSKSGHKIATKSSDNIVRVWNIQTDALIASFQHQDVVTAITFSPDGQYLVIGSNHDKTAKVWDLQKQKKLVSLEHNYIVSSVNFTPDGKNIITTSVDNKVRIWDFKTGKILMALDHNLEFRQKLF